MFLKVVLKLKLHVRKQHKTRMRNNETFTYTILSTYMIDQSSDVRTVLSEDNQGNPKHFIA